MNSLDFSHQDVERAASYHRPRYAAAAAAFALGAAVYAALACGPPGHRLWRLVDGLGWAGSAAAGGGCWGAVALGWLAGRAKGLGLGLLFTAGGWTAGVGLARAFPGSWPLAAGALLALAVLVLAYVSGFGATCRVVLSDTLLS